MNRELTVKHILEELSTNFEKKITKDYRITLQYEFTDIDRNNIWKIEVKD